MQSGFVGKMRLRIEISCVLRVNKRFRNLLQIKFAPPPPPKKKIESPRKQFTSFPLVTLECCCLPGKLQKQRKFVASFVQKIGEIPAIVSNLGDWCAAKTRACLLRFYALKMNLIHAFLQPSFPGLLSTEPGNEVGLSTVGFNAFSNFSSVLWPGPQFQTNNQLAKQHFKSSCPDFLDHSLIF